MRKITRALFPFPKIPQIFPQNTVETNVLNRSQNRSFLGKKKKENLRCIIPFAKFDGK